MRALDLLDGVSLGELHLTPEQAVLALPDELLRGLSDEYLASLPEGIRAAVRARIGH